MTAAALPPEAPKSGAPAPQTDGHAHGHSHGLSPFTKAFVYAVAVADVLAVVYFGGTWLVTGSLVPHADKAPIVVAGAEETAAPTAAAAPVEPAFDLATYVADPVKGEKVAAKCKACHTFEQGGPNRVGPNQWGIMGAALGHAPGFAYSDALMAKKAEVPVWTDEAMDAFLADPRGWMPGTKMQFNGIRNPQERADLIAWMKTLK